MNYCLVISITTQLNSDHSCTFYSYLDFCTCSNISSVPEDTLINTSSIVVTEIPKLDTPSCSLRSI